MSGSSLLNGVSSQPEDKALKLRARRHPYPIRLSSSSYVFFLRLHRPVEHVFFLRLHRPGPQKFRTPCTRYQDQGDQCERQLSERAVHYQAPGYVRVHSMLLIR